MQTQRIAIKRVGKGQATAVSDEVASEEPLEIKLSFVAEEKRTVQNVSVTMRTPGSDSALAIGFLFTEGIIQSPKELANPATVQLGENTILVALSPTAQPDVARLKRNFYTTSSCGVCGKESIEAIRQVCRKTAPTDFKIKAQILGDFPEKLRSAQQVFKNTGGIHAAAFFDRWGNLLSLQEDVGRHNALDKLIGAELLKTESEALHFAEKILLLSGRGSFELIQKAAMAGISIVCAVGAPSSLAVTTAKEFGITLIGFLKKSTFNLYCGAERIEI